MLRHIIPQQKVGLPEDFRPWVKVCKNYVTSGPTIPAPMPPKDMVFPTGGEFYPPGRYSANIDVESNLKTLNYPLDKWCPSTKYIPRQDSNMYVSGSTVPDRKPTSDAFVSELAMPQALLRTDIYTAVLKMILNISIEAHASLIIPPNKIDMVLRNFIHYLVVLEEVNQCHTAV